MHGDLLSRLPQLRRIMEAETLAATYAAAERDGHGLLFPTHVVVKENVPVGAFSIAGCPMVTMWLDRQAMKPRESLGLINAVENMVLASGLERGAVLVAPESPFHEVMEALGYRNQGTFTVFTKGH